MQVTVRQIETLKGLAEDWMQGSQFEKLQEVMVAVDAKTLGSEKWKMAKGLLKRYFGIVLVARMRIH